MITGGHDFVLDDFAWARAAFGLLPAGGVA